MEDEFQSRFLQTGSRFHKFKDSFQDSLTPSGLQKRSQMAIIDYVYNRNHQ